MGRKFFAFCMLSLATFGANANWEKKNGYYDDGSRFTVTVRGGIAMPKAAIQNDMGRTPVDYWAAGTGIFPDDPTCGGTDDFECVWFADKDLGTLAAAKKYDSISFAGGFAVGMTMAGKPNVRMEMDWLRISESTYDANPLFSGEVDVLIDTPAGEEIWTLPITVGSARSAMTMDAVSAMIYYDFWSGRTKPVNTMIPYVGVGFGYALATTTLELADPELDLKGFSWGAFRPPVDTPDDAVNFYTSENTKGGFAVSGAAGVSYGLSEGMFLDIGARGTYVPKITWALNNDGDSNRKTYKEKPIFSANDVIFFTVYAGLRFEF